jgi:hypothetical protein
MTNSPHPTQSYPGQRSGAAAGSPQPPTVAVWVAALVGPLMMVASIPTFGYSQHTTTAQLGMILASGGSLVTLISVAIAGVMVLIWMSRARAFADSRNPGPRIMSPGMALGGWFIPIINLWLPAQAMIDVVRASDPTMGQAADPSDAPGQSPARSRLESRVWQWWAAWLGSWLVLWLGLVLIPVVGPASPRLMPMIAMLLLLLSVLLLIGAAALLTTVMRQVWRWQGEQT